MAQIKVNDTFDTRIPSSPEAEQALLGSILLDNDTMYSVNIKPVDFYLEKHAWIFEAMCALSDEKRPIDVVTLIAKLEQREKLSDVGGDAYIIGLLSATPTSVNCAAYAEEIKRHAIRRQLLLVATQIAGMVTDPKLETPEQLISEAHRALLKIEHPQFASDGITLYNAIGEFFPELNDYLDGKREIWGVPTGLTDLDNFIGGLAFGEMTLIAADPALGKTLLASTIWLNAGKLNYAGVFFSLEMARRQLMLRLFADRGNISTYDIRRGNVTEQEHDSMMDEIYKIQNLPLWIYDAPMDTVTIHREIMRLQRQVDLKFAVVDYTGLLKDSSARGEVERQLVISHGLKNVAKQTGIALLVIHPVTRGVNRQSEPPSLSDLGWGRVYEYDAHTCLMPWFDQKRTDFSALIKITKSRDGTANKTIPMMFDGRRWRNAAR